MSEIDHIFATKGKPKTTSQQVSSPSLLSKKKKKRRSNAVTTQNTIQPEFSKKRRLPDTIVDTSHEITTLAKRQKKVKSNPEGNSEDIATFKDSRGNTGRKRTEEGWLVYKEDELNINHQSGDTELCPFDCKCCF